MNNDFWDEFQNLLVITHKVEIEYRLHYNELGEITCCTMQQHPDSDSYIVVTKEEYDNYFQYRVVNGKLVRIEHDKAGCRSATLRLLARWRHRRLRLRRRGRLLLVE